MKIALVSGEVPSSTAGGIATVVAALGPRLSERGHVVDYYCSAKFESTGFDATYVNQWGPHPVHDVSFGLSFKQLGHVLERYDVVDFHLPNARGPLLFSAQLDMPKLATLHTTSLGYRDRVYRRLAFEHLAPNERRQKRGFINIAIALERRALRRATLVNCVADNVFDEAINGYGLENVVRTRKGVDSRATVERHAGPRAADAPFVFVGRLVAQKGLFDLLAAVHQGAIGRRLEIVGDGPLRPQLEAYATRFGLNVSFAGFRERREVDARLADARAIVIPSLYETQPMVAFEAAALGLPIIAYAGAAVGDAVPPQAERLTQIDTGDVSALAAALREVDESDELVDELGSAIASWHARLDRCEQMASDFESHYRRLVETR